MKVKLKHITPELYLDSDIAIVGSDNSIRRRNWTREINNFNEVVRFNRSPVKNFKKIVGKKTTLRVVNSEIFANEPFTDRWKGAGQPQYFIRDQRNINILQLSPGLGEWNDKNHINNTCISYILMPEIYHTLPTAKSKNKGRKFPTLGYLFIWLCIESGIKPVLFGYGVGIYPPTHYWEKRDTETICHNYNFEHKEIFKWEQQGKLIIK